MSLALSDAPASAPTTQRDGLGRAGWLAVAVAATAMACIGFWGLDRGSMWQDESATLDVTSRTLPQIVAMSGHADAVHAAYYAVIHGWMQLGSGEVWMRVPSVLAAAAAAGVLAALGTRLVGARAGLAAGLLFAATPFVSFYAQEGRSYALVAACVLAGTYALVRALATGRRIWWAGYAAALTAASLLHEFAVLALAAHALTLLVSRSTWRVWRWWLGCAALCVVLVAPVVLVSARQSGQVGWLPTPGLGTLTELARLLAGPSPVVVVAVMALAVLGLTVPALGAGVPRVGAVALPLAVVPAFSLIAVSLVHPLYHPRYVFYAVAGVALLAGAGLDRLVARVLRGRRGWIGWIICVLVPLVGFVIQLPEQIHERTPQSRTNDLAAAARIVGQGAEPGDGVLFLPSRYRAAVLGYPAEFTAVHDVGLAASPVAASNLRGRNLTVTQSRAAMLATPRLWVVGRPGLSVRANEPLARAQQRVLTESFTRVSQTRVWGMQVSLYVRR